jgi:DNA-binding GntR family transcriptional regulator
MPAPNPLVHVEAGSPSRLSADLAARILDLLKEQKAGIGHHLVELDLCRHFGVSRTPVRGALKLLAAQGIVELRANRGFVVSRSVEAIPALEPADDRHEDDRRLFVAIAEARMTGKLPDQCSQQEIVRAFDTKLAVVLRVLRQMAEIGLVERKTGHGWSFLPSIDSGLAQNESYRFRMVLEPAALLEPTFHLDREWVRKARSEHERFRNRPWRDTLAVEFYEMNADFHERLALFSGNRYMHSCMQQQNQLRRFLNYHWEYGVDRVQESIDEHLAILALLERGDNAGAAAMMRSHLDSAKTAYSVIDLATAGASRDDARPR